MFTVATTSQIRSLESAFIAKCNARWGQVLMELAGSEAAKVAYQLYKDSQSHELTDVLILCGSGNNGGDGLVIARFLHLWNVPTKVLIISKSAAKTDQKMNTEEANANLAIAQDLGISVHFISDTKKLPLQNICLIIDGLLGTGLDRSVEGIYQDLIDQMNSSDKAILAVDLPSGVNSDTGQIMGVAVKATQTVTFGYLKTGLLCYPAAELCGKLNLIDIGLPALDEKRKPKVSLTTVNYVASLLPTRKPNSNKGTYGTLLTIAGSLGMMGATMMSTESSLRIGCGLAILAVPRSLILELPAKEIIYKALSETDKLSIHPKAIEELKDELSRASALVLGPGMSTHPQTVEFVQKFVSETLGAIKTIPCIIDADALNAIAQKPDCLPSKHPFVLTPHPKELSRLMDIPTEQIQADRVAAALNAAKRFSSVVLLKGANTVIADPNGIVFINPTGSAAMAKAGAGDVLSGIIGGLLAQGLAPLDAAIAGAYIHGCAGDLASEIHGQSGVMSGEISTCIPDAISAIHDGRQSALEENLSETITLIR